MADLTVKFWRDIPAMVMIGRGRTAAKAPLPERFEQAIDRCAMKVGAKDADAYLAEWRTENRGPAPEGDAGGPQHVAERIAASLDAEYDDTRLRELIAQDGWSAPK